GQLGFHNSDIGLVLGVTQGFFRMLAGFQRLCFIQVVCANRGIRQYSDFPRLNLEYAASDKDVLFAAIVHNDLQRAGTNPRDQGSVTGQNTQFSSLAGQRHALCLTSKDRFFGTDHVNMKLSHEQSLLLNSLGFFESLVDGTDHVERLFWQSITLAVDDHLEAT